MRAPSSRDTGVITEHHPCAICKASDCLRDSSESKLKSSTCEVDFPLRNCFYKPSLWSLHYYTYIFAYI